MTDPPAVNDFPWLCLGKSVKDLKKERTAAKCSFTKQANFILRGGNTMLQEEMKEEFTKMSYLFRKLMEANDEYRFGLEADIKEEDPGADLDGQQEADIANSIKEAETKQEELRDFVQNKSVVKI